MTSLGAISVYIASTLSPSVGPQGVLKVGIKIDCVDLGEIEIHHRDDLRLRDRWDKLVRRCRAILS